MIPVFLALFLYWTYDIYQSNDNLVLLHHISGILCILGSLPYIDVHFLRMLIYIVLIESVAYVEKYKHTNTRLFYLYAFIIRGPYAIYETFRCVDFLLINGYYANIMVLASGLLSICYWYFLYIKRDISNRLDDRNYVF